MASHKPRFTGHCYGCRISYARQKKTKQPSKIKQTFHPDNGVASYVADCFAPLTSYLDFDTNHPPLLLACHFKLLRNGMIVLGLFAPFYTDMVINNTLAEFFNFVIFFGFLCTLCVQLYYRHLADKLVCRFFHLTSARHSVVTHYTVTPSNTKYIQYILCVLTGSVEAAAYLFVIVVFF